MLELIQVYDLLKRFNKAGSSSNDRQSKDIGNIQDLRHYLKGILDKGCEIEISEEDIDELLEIMSKE